MTFPIFFFAKNNKILPYSQSFVIICIIFKKLRIIKKQINIFLIVITCLLRHFFGLSKYILCTFDTFFNGDACICHNGGSLQKQFFNRVNNRLAFQFGDFFTLLVILKILAGIYFCFI